MRLSGILPRDRIRRDTCLLLGAQAFYKFSGVVLPIVLSRCLSAEDIGVYFFVISFAAILAILADLNLNPVMMRRVAAQPENAPVHLAHLLGFRLAAGPVYLLCVTMAALAMTRGLWPLVAVAALFTLLETIYSSFANLFLGLKQAVYNVSIGVPAQILFLAILLVGMWQLPSLEVLMGVHLVRSLCLVGAALLVTRRWICPVRLSWDSSLLKEGMPFLLISLVATFGGNIDTLLLAFFTDYEIVGHYQLAFRVVLASQFVPGVLGLVLFPHFAAEGLDAANRRRLVGGAASLAAAGLVLAGAVLLFAEPLAALLYGPLAAAVVPLLQPLTILFPLGFLNVFLSFALQALHCEKQALRALVLAMATMFIADCALIPFIGAYGAVYAAILAALVQLGSLLWYLRQIFGRPQPLPECPRGNDDPVPGANLQ